MNEAKPAADYSSLRALYLNATLKPSPSLSHTDGLIEKSRKVMEQQGVSTELVRLVDHEIAPGVYPDMTEHGFDRDDWPSIHEKIMNANILVLCGPIWLGDNSSEMRKAIERIYAHSGEQNEKGQYLYYGKVGGCLITGNEDGAKHCAMNVLYSLQHVGYTIPPQADAAWIGEAGPGPSYLDKGSGGPENDFTNRNVTFMAWNLMHTAAILQANDGLPAHGNQISKWDKAPSEQENPEYR